MQKINIVSIESYYNENSMDFINGILKDSIYLTSTYDIKSFRQNTIELENNNCLFLAFNTFLKTIKNSISCYGGYITLYDQIFILGQTIKKLYGEDERGKTFYRIKKQIFELFNVLIYKNISEFDDGVLTKIKNKSNEGTAEIFNLYNEFIKNLEKVKEAKSELLNFDNQEGNFSLYQDVLINELTNKLKDKKALVMEGFLFLTLEQQQLIKAAYKLNKNIYLITKKNIFVNNDIYIPLLEELSAEANYIDISGKDLSRKQNSIAEISDNLFVNKNIKGTIDNSVLFYEPFVNREQEFRFIISDILKYIKETCGDDIEKKKNAITKELAVRLYTKKDVKHFNELLNQMGAGFKISANEHSVLDFALGQFIYNIYKIVNDNIDIETYKKLLFTQWKYNKDCNAEKYDEALKDFSSLEVYFKKLSTIEDWLYQIEEIIAIKKEIDNNDVYIYHPINVAGSDNLIFIQNHLIFIKNITDRLKNIEGTNNEHIECLKELLLTEDNNLDEIKKVFDIIDSFNDKSMLKIGSKYFSESIRAMLSEYELEVEQNENDLYLQLLYIENFNKCKRVYIPKFELGVYPQNVEKAFPFTQNILYLLKDDEIGINYRVYPFIENDYHFFIKNYFDLTEEIIIFTQAQAENGNPTLPSVYVEDIFTLYNSDIQYIKTEIETIETKPPPMLEFISPVLEHKLINFPNLLLFYVCPKMFYFINNNKTVYTEEIQLNLYASHILFVRFFENFVSLNKGMVFTLDKNLQAETEKILKKTLNEISRVFNYLSNIELNDIFVKCLDSIYYFYTTKLRNEKFGVKYFSLELLEPKILNINNYLIKLDRRLVVKNTENGNAKDFDICKGLYFLVNRSDGKEYDYKHYSQLIEQLDCYLTTDDRLKLVDFAFFKIDVQLASNFYEDGIKRIKDLVNVVKASRFCSIPSSYCKFCKIKNTCKGLSCGETL